MIFWWTVHYWVNTEPLPTRYPFFNDTGTGGECLYVAVKHMFETSKGFLTSSLTYLLVLLDVIAYIAAQGVSG